MLAALATSITQPNEERQADGNRMTVLAADQGNKLGAFPEKGAITMSTNELKARLDEYREYKALLNELQDTIAALEDDIKAYMGDQEEINVAGVKVHWKRYELKRFDSKTFKAEHAAMYEQYIKITDARRFSVA